MSAFDDWDDDDDPVSDDPSGDGYDDSDSSLGAQGYVEQFQEMLDRFNNWADENGWERATNLDEEVDKIIDRYRIQTGDFSGLDDFKMPEPIGPYALMDRPDQLNFHLMDPIDPRAFDFVKLEIFAWDRGYNVTSSLGGTHGEFSFHTDGRAVDIGVQGLSDKQVQQMKDEFTLHGIRVYDETDKSKWTENTTGYHLHVDTATPGEIIERTEAKSFGLDRVDIGLSPNWPLRLRP